MPEKSVERVTFEHAVLDIGDDIGALIIHSRRELCGQQLDVSPKGRTWQRIHTDILERQANHHPVFVALFLALPADDYLIWGQNPQPIGEVTIVGGQVIELHWSHLLPEILFPAFTSLALSSQLSDLFPPRYCTNKSVSAAPMGSASLLYDEQGLVAWDQMWTSFCDLALAGGPPHRGTLLEPVSPEEVHADPEGYQRVITELKRGLQLVTGLPVVLDRQPGWIGLQCADEEMALWLLRAIIVENVCVRREENILWFPAGPAFQLAKEIKNVITVVAKIHHYWIEHAQRQGNALSILV